MDYRLKISGDSKPFIIGLYCCDTNTILQQQAVDYPNECVIFDGLSANTEYTICLVDYIGQTYSKNIQTISQVEPDVSPEKTISLLGETQISTMVCYTQSTGIDISPDLSLNDNLTLCLAACIENNNHGGIYAEVIVCKQCQGDGNWITMENINTNAIPSGCYDFSLDLLKGDSFKYHMMTMINSISGCAPGVYSGCTKLEIKDDSKGNYFDVIVNPTQRSLTTDYSVTVQPTTTQTTLPTITVFLDDITSREIFNTREVTAKIKTTPSLSSGQSFKLNFTNSAESIPPAEGIGLTDDIAACAVLNVGTTEYGKAQSRVSRFTNRSITDSKNSNVTVDSSNIDDILIKLIADPDDVLSAENFTNQGKFYIRSITNSVGGNFDLNIHKREVIARSNRIIPNSGGGDGGDNGGVIPV